ncbi:hypothetical protein CMEL01_13445 [Colletotrichum melonis]|uniref:Uncharacterized protein n=1 Tax=Colletotrichum melonis TaxID=1209925 RepID=A0AAI9XWK1_9PEZI|nr:hypothetical protein CMEL01_13445 [Colletotrichum melonis]
MSSESSPVKKAAIQESADSRGPSEFSEREISELATKAINRLSETCNAFIHSFDAFFSLLSRLNIVARPLSVHNTPEIWRAHWEELRDAIVEVYDLADNLLDLTLQTEEYIDTTGYESLLVGTNTFLAAMKAPLPQALHDTLVGKGKGVAKSK